MIHIHSKTITDKIKALIVNLYIKSYLQIKSQIQTQWGARNLVQIIKIFSRSKFTVGPESLMNAMTADAREDVQSESSALYRVQPNLLNYENIYSMCRIFINHL